MNTAILPQWCQYRHNTTTNHFPNAYASYDYNIDSKTIICDFLKCFRGRQSVANMSLIILKKSASSTRYIFLYSWFQIFFYSPHNRQLSKHVSSCTPFGQTSYHHLTWFFSLQLTIINQCLRMGVTFAQTRGSAISIYIINNEIFFHYFWMMIIFSPGFFCISINECIEFTKFWGFHIIYLDRMYTDKMILPTVHKSI